MTRAASHIFPWMLIAALTLLGCGHKAPAPLPKGNPTPRIETIRDQTERSTLAIDAAAVSGRNKAPALSEWSDILAANGNIKATVTDLGKVGIDVSSMQAYGDQQKKRADDCADDKAPKLNWLIVSCIVAIGGAIVLLYAAKNMPVGGMLAKSAAAGVVVSGLSIIMLCLFVQNLQPMLKWFVPAMVIIGTGYLIWHLFVERRATKQLVASGQVLKSAIQPSAREAVLGKDGLLNKIQSGTTTAMVEATKPAADALVCAAEAETPPIVPAPPV